MANRTFREKNKSKVESFSTLFLVSTLKWITEKELERVIKKKGDEFSWKKKAENFKAAVRKCEILAASKEKLAR